VRLTPGIDLRALVQSSLVRTRRAARLAVAVLREIGDENAYARYLARHGQAHSAAAWRAFSDERLRAKFVRPKCC
jgi:hypothetical protein